MTDDNAGSATSGIAAAAVAGQELRFTQNPRVLMSRPFSVLPNRDDTPNEQINSVARLGLYVGIILSLRNSSFKPILIAIGALLGLELSGGFDAFFTPGGSSAHNSAVAEALAEEAKYTATTQPKGAPVIPEASPETTDRMSHGPVEGGARRVDLVPTEETVQFSTRPRIFKPPSEADPSAVDFGLETAGLVGTTAHGGKANAPINY